jgi:hypothetical protein
MYPVRDGHYLTEPSLTEEGTMRRELVNNVLREAYYIGQYPISFLFYQSVEFMSTQKRI